MLARVLFLATVAAARQHNGVLSTLESLERAVDSELAEEFAGMERMTCKQNFKSIQHGSTTAGSVFMPSQQDVDDCTEGFKGLVGIGPKYDCTACYASAEHVLVCTHRTNCVGIQHKGGEELTGARGVTRLPWQKHVVGAKRTFVPSTRSLKDFVVHTAKNQVEKWQKLKAWGNRLYDKIKSSRFMASPSSVFRSYAGKDLASVKSDLSATFKTWKAGLKNIKFSTDDSASTLKSLLMWAGEHQDELETTLHAQITDEAGLERLREKWAAELERGGPDLERKIDPRGGCINIVLTADGGIGAIGGAFAIEVGFCMAYVQEQLLTKFTASLGVGMMLGPMGGASLGQGIGLAIGVPKECTESPEAWEECNGGGEKPEIVQQMAIEVEFDIGFGAGAAVFIEYDTEEGSTIFDPDHYNAVGAEFVFKEGANAEAAVKYAMAMMIAGSNPVELAKQIPRTFRKGYDGLSEAFSNIWM